MMHARSVFLQTLPWLVVAASCVVCVVLPSYADEYSDASQLVRTNKFDEALVRVDGYLATKPTDPQMRFLKGVIQRNLGKQADAIVTFTKLTEDYPELPEPYNNLAVLYAGQGQYDKARVALEMAIRTNPSYATAHENIGDVYARLASQAYNKALQLDSSNLVVPPKLALIREVFRPNLGNARQVSAVSQPGQPNSLLPHPAPSPAPRSTPHSLLNSLPAPRKTPLVLNTPEETSTMSVPKSPGAPTQPTSLPTVTRPPVVMASAPRSGASQTVPMTEAASTPLTVEETVLAWANAWSAKDMSAYLKTYSPDFTPAGRQTRSAWVQDRHNRIMGKSHISVKITELRLKVSDDVAQAKFRQAYKADALSISSRKTLDLRKNGTQWLIIRESTGR